MSIAIKFLCAIFNRSEVPMRFMKILSLFILAILCCKTYAHENLSHSHQECSLSATPDSSQKAKIYLHPENIVFHGKDIYVLLNQNWIQTNAIFSDNSGIYMYDNKGGWTCGYCGYYNEGSYWTCDRCGKRRNDVLEK